MWLLTLLACLFGAQDDTLFPNWRSPWTSSPPAGAQAQVVGPLRADDTGWIVLKEHPALARDSTASVDIGENPAATILLWPFDHVVRPTLHSAMRPLHSAIDYSEKTNVIDRGIRLMHPTGSDDVWLYPIATLDGTEGSRWGLVYQDENFLARRWVFRSSAALTVEQDMSAAMGGRTNPFSPAGLSLHGGVSTGRARAIGIRVPGATHMDDATPTGYVSQDRCNYDAGISGNAPLKGAGWDVSYGYSWRSSGLPARLDQEFPNNVDSLAWFRYGDRGIEGREVDRTLSLGFGWSDQDRAGAPTSGGPVRARVWQTWADGGGDVRGMDVSATRCFLLGSERYVYRADDLKPYVDLDPREIVRILDPTTLRERLTQRKILILGLRYSRIWETDPNGVPASYFQFPTMGGDAPARGYPSGYLMDRTVAGASMEYRWPIWKYVDGVSFLEMAWASPGWWFDATRRLAPGGGAGFRARLDRLFLFRGYLAYGRVGFQYSLTTSSEF